MSNVIDFYQLMNVAIKNGVSLKGLQPQASLAMFFALAVCARHNADFTIAAVLHNGFGFDMATGDMDDATVASVFAELLAAMGDEFTVTLEDASVRVDYDPENQFST